MDDGGDAARIPSDAVETGPEGHTERRDAAPAGETAIGGELVEDADQLVGAHPSSTDIGRNEVDSCAIRPTGGGHGSEETGVGAVSTSDSEMVAREMVAREVASLAAAEHVGRSADRLDVPSGIVAVSRETPAAHDGSRTFVESGGLISMPPDVNREGGAVVMAVTDNGSAADRRDLLDTSQDPAELRRILANESLAPIERRTFLLSLGSTADPGDNASVDALVREWSRFGEDPFLGASVIEALGRLAKREQLASIELLRLIIRLPSPETAGIDLRYIFITAARVSSQVEALCVDPRVRSTLSGWATATDPAIQAEARFRLGLLELLAAFHCPTRTELLAHLFDAKQSLTNARISEEVRPDAHLLELLIVELLRFSEQVEHWPTASEDFSVPSEIREYLVSDYISRREFRQALTAWRMVNGLRTMRSSLSESRAWLRLDEAVLGLAQIVHEMLNEHGEAVLTGVTEKILVPSLGEHLRNCLTRLQMQRILELLDSADLSDRARGCLRAVEAAMAQVTSTGPLTEDPEFLTRLGMLAEQVRCEPTVFMSDLISDLATGDPNNRMGAALLGRRYIPAISRT